MSDSLWPHGLLHTRLLCASLLPRVCPSSCPLSQWGYPTISSSASLFFFFCPPSFPASGSFPMSRLFASGGLSTRASASVLPMNIQDWFPLGLTGLISLLSKGLSRVFSNTTVQKHQFFGSQLSVRLSHPYMTTGKITALTIWTFVGKVTFLLFNMLSCHSFYPRGKCLLISWLRSPSTVYPVLSNSLWSVLSWLLINFLATGKTLDSSLHPYQEAHRRKGLDTLLLLTVHSVLT